MWYDHPTWWQWMILVGIAVIMVFVAWGIAGGGSGDSTNDPL